MDGPMEDMLTISQAFDAMTKFLEGYYERISSDDVGSLLGDMRILKDVGTVDSAAWDDWIQSIHAVLHASSEPAK